MVLREQQRSPTGMLKSNNKPRTRVVGLEPEKNPEEHLPGKNNWLKQGQVMPIPDKRSKMTTIWTN